MKINIKDLGFLNIELEGVKDFLSMNNRGISVIEQSKLEDFCKYNITRKETEDKLKLIISKIEMEEEDGEYYLVSRYTKTNTFSKIDHTYTEEFDLLSIADELTLNSNLRYDEKVSKSGTKQLYSFLFEILKIKNEELFEVMERTLVKSKYSYGLSNVMFENLYNASIHYTLGFEKLYKINPLLIIDTIQTNVIDVKNEGKINKVSDLPKYVINYINKNNYTEMFPYLQDLKVKDGNDYRILLDFLDNSGVLVKPSDREGVYTQFVKNFSKITQLGDYTIQDLLRFLIKESYYNKSFSYTTNLNELVFTFPSEEAHLMVDYLEMAKKNEVEPIKYPNIKVDHDVMMKNLQFLKNENEEDFIKAVNQYKGMVETFKAKELEMIVPENIKSMIDEGVNLHHCVASYTPDVINKTSKIFFLRHKDDLEKSYFTVELDASNKVNHVRGKFQEIPDNNIIKIIEDWAKEYQ